MKQHYISLPQKWRKSLKEHRPPDLCSKLPEQSISRTWGVDRHAVKNMFADNTVGPYSLSQFPLKPPVERVPLDGCLSHLVLSFLSSFLLRRMCTHWSRWFTRSQRVLKAIQMAERLPGQEYALHLHIARLHPWATTHVLPESTLSPWYTYWNAFAHISSGLLWRNYTQASRLAKY